MTTAQNKNYALPITMMFLLFAMIAYVTGLGSPIGVILKGQFGASDSAATLGSAANFIAYAFMGIPAGLLLQKKGYKKTTLIAIGIGFIGILIQYFSGFLKSFPVYVGGAFVAGFSMCLLNTVVNPMLNTLGGGGKKGNQLLQFGGTLSSISATITPVLIGYLIGNAVKPTIKDVNPALYIAMGVFAIVFIVFALVNIPEPSYETDEKAVFIEKDRHSAFSFRHFVLGIIGIFIYVGVEVGIPMFIIYYLKEGLGKDAAIAGSVAGTYWILMLVGRLLGGIVGGRVSNKTMLSVASSLGLLFVLIAIFSETTQIKTPAVTSELVFSLVDVPVGVLFLVLCGLCTSVMWGGIFSLAVEGLGKHVKMASGIFMVMVCGGGILPWIQGLVADKAGYISSYWVIFLGFAYLLFYALIGSKNVNKDIST